MKTKAISLFLAPLMLITTACDAKITAERIVKYNASVSDAAAVAKEYIHLLQVGNNISQDDAVKAYEIISVGVAASNEIAAAMKAGGLSFQNIVPLVNAVIDRLPAFDEKYFSSPDVARAMSTFKIAVMGGKTLLDTFDIPDSKEVLAVTAPADISKLDATLLQNDKMLADIGTWLTSARANPVGAGRQR